MTFIDYDEHMYKTYQKARNLIPSTHHQWMKVILEFVNKKEGLTVLDIGCGTGRFSPLLADFLDAWVYGVEPSDSARAKKILSFFS